MRLVDRCRHLGSQTLQQSLLLPLGSIAQEDLRRELIERWLGFFVGLPHLFVSLLISIYP